jgi:flagellin FlaB
MLKRLYGVWKDERGITALETAIILIAFVVVAAVFAFTILSAGTFLTERSEEAAYAGLEEVRGSLQRKGDVVAYEGSTSDEIGKISFKVSLVAGGEPVDLNTGDDAVVHISYRDSEDEFDLNALNAWGVDFPVGDDPILEGSEIAEIYVCLNGDVEGCSDHDPEDDVSYVDPQLTNGETFNIEVIPPSGAVLNIERTIPASVEQVLVLN